MGSDSLSTTKPTLLPSQEEHYPANPSAALLAFDTDADTDRSSSSSKRPSTVTVVFISLLLTTCFALSAAVAFAFLFFSKPPDASPFESTARSLKKLPRPVVLLISSDGFRFGYQFKTPTPNIHRLISNGTEADQGLIPVFPTLTFPNHYSIVTGLYPAYHGIINNHFVDPHTGEFFTMASHEPKWWLGEHYGVHDLRRLPEAGGSADAGELLREPDSGDIHWDGGGAAAGEQI